MYCARLTCTYLSQLIISLKTQVQKSFLHLSASDTNFHWMEQDFVGQMWILWTPVAIILRMYVSLQVNPHFMREDCQLLTDYAQSFHYYLPVVAICLEANVRSEWTSLDLSYESTDHTTVGTRHTPEPRRLSISLECPHAVQKSNMSMQIPWELHQLHMSSIFPSSKATVSVKYSIGLCFQNNYIAHSVWRWATDWTAGFRFPAKARFFPSPQSPYRLWAHPASYQTGTVGSFPGSKADHSPPSSAEVKNNRVIPPLPDKSSLCGVSLIVLSIVERMVGPLASITPRTLMFVYIVQHCLLSHLLL
jgi:hypothetical protein